MKKLNQSGFHLVELMIAIITVATIGFVGWRIFGAKTEQLQSVNHDSQVSAPPAPVDTEPVIWQFDDIEWATLANNEPDCPEPMVVDSPVDLSKVITILYPGQVRGTHFKAHGGFGMKNGSNSYEVRAPIDMVLAGGVRYLEAGELQYKFEFDHPCGIRIMFDHLMTMATLFDPILSTMPEAKVDDTRTDWRPTAQLEFKKGDLIATAVGHTGNPGFDFGLYDLRQPNQASKDATFAQARGNEKSYNFYAQCWFDWLSPPDAAAVRALPSRDQAMGKKSDYCK